MAKTLGTVINAGLKEIREPEITEFTADNILQQRLIEEANNSRRELLGRRRFNWGLNRTVLTTTDDVTTGSVAVTNGSTTVTSVDSDGNDAANFANVTTAMWFRVDNTQTSYSISSVQNSTTPHQIVLGEAYVDDTATATAYRTFQDTYSLTASDLDELQIVAYGNSGHSLAALAGQGRDHNVLIRDLSALYIDIGGDPHQNSSGKPQALSLIGVDSSDQPQVVLWPFPTEVLHIELWYSVKYTENTTFATNLFNGDAPDLAYDAIEHRVRATACIWDEDYDKAAVWEQRAQTAVNLVLRRENNEAIDKGLTVATYRQQASSGFRGRNTDAWMRQSARR